MTLALLAASLFLLTKLEILDSPERWMPRPTVEAWGVFDSHFDVGDTVAVGLHFTRPITEEDLPRLSNLRKQFAAIPGVKQVYDTSLVAEQIEGVPLMTLLGARESRSIQSVCWRTVGYAPVRGSDANARDGLRAGIPP